MKLLGFILVFSSFSFVGISLSRGSELSCHQLQTLIELIRFLRRNISHSRLPLWELLDGFEVRDKSMRVFFSLLRDKRNIDGTSVRFEKASAVLDDDVKDLCVKIGAELGKCTYDEELARLDRLESEAVELLSHKQASLEKNKRLFRSVFPLVGLVVSILLL